MDSQAKKCQILTGAMHSHPSVNTSAQPYSKKCKYL